jgi:anaerobic selenocysteine-containing dehydrogenase/Fe-S-cluster-containing dehydrogenase component
MSDSPPKQGVRRREFLKVLGATTAAGAAACSEPTGKLIPYLVSPDNTVPGVSTYYATTCRECAAACGIIAETRDGRVTKLEGNPEHPLNHGALCARGQSALHGLYNPDRFRTPMIKTGGAWRAATWDDAINLLAQRLTEARGRGAAGGAVFLNQHESGSFPAFLDAWLAAHGMRPHLSVDFEADHGAIEAHRRAYGAAWPRFDFASARLIISFGADFLDGWGALVPHQLDFAEARAKLRDAPRFIYVGPRRSLTGLNADQWIACRPGTELAIANFLQGRGDANATAQTTGVQAATLQRLRQEYAAARPVLALAGGRGENGVELASAAAALNQSRGGAPIASFEGISRQSEVLAAVERMRAGQVGIAFVRGPNPAYALPKSVKFAEAFGRVPLKVSFSPFPDETTELCDIVLPDLHSLESWGDAEPVRGTLSLQQPAMDPVFTGTRGAADVLIAVARKDAAMGARYPQADYGAWLRARLPGGSNAQTLAAALARGVTSGSSAARPVPPAPSAAIPIPAASTTGDFFLVTYVSPTLGDGRGANKPWLQELPDPVTKVLWSSWVELHPETAGRLGIERGDIVEVRTDAGSVRAPAYVYLGIRPDTVAIALGQGHASSGGTGWYDGKSTDLQWGYGRYARGVGANALDLLTARLNSGGALIGTSRCAISKTGDHETLVSPEGSARQHDRGIARAIAVTQLGQPEEHAGHGEIPGAPPTEFLPGLRSPVAADAQGELGSPTAKDRGKMLGMYDPSHPTQMTKRRWAMTIDLARCTGCAACVTACYAENNIPTVGASWQNGVVYAVKKPGFNITRGREMNWMRLERYFEGAEDGQFTEDFETRFVPMLCQHCGNAPCEPVCPVYATYQSPDGLNVQVYNRCVGTRYCSNNCPYKVRYFNWFGYGEPDRVQYAFPEPLHMQLNPDVTVRSKGVMEKCTFCVQRIREAENRAVAEQRDVAADEFTVACAAACPSRAIVFGDAADASWSVGKMIEDERAYHVFEELNTYTGVVYLKKVNHPAGGATPAPPAAAPH